MKHPADITDSELPNQDCLQPPVCPSKGLPPPHSSAAMSHHVYLSMSRSFKNVKLTCPMSVPLAILSWSPRPHPICSPDSRETHPPPPPLGDAPTSCPHSWAPGHHGLLKPLRHLLQDSLTVGCMLGWPLHLSCPHTRQSRLPSACSPRSM